MILVVEDHDKIRTNMILQLREAGHETQGFALLSDARKWLSNHPIPELMLLDMRLGEGSGLDLIRSLAEAGDVPPIIVVSGEATISETVEALRLGVYDFLEKPVSRRRLLRSVENCLDHHRLKQQVNQLQTKLGRDQMLGDAPAMLTLRRNIDTLAPTRGRVLILGESGTGKELVANMLHHRSGRAAGPFLKINCAAIPANLIEAELFGHVKGAFTDARSDKPGLFEEADGGTLFLDEIGDMELQLQARLLRVLEDGRVRRIGDRVDRSVDVRVICATHCDLESRVEAGEFRRDLYFRIGGIPLYVPPLRDRAEDIPMLLACYLAHYSRMHEIEPKRLSDGALETLKTYSWPGNIRELKNLCERLVILGGTPIEREHLPENIVSEAPGKRTKVDGFELPMGLTLKDFRARCERHYIEATLDHVDNNYARAAEMLDIKRTYLYQKATALGLRH